MPLRNPFHTVPQLSSYNPDQETAIFTLANALPDFNKKSRENDDQGEEGPRFSRAGGYGAARGRKAGQEPLNGCVTVQSSARHSQPPYME